MFIDNNLPILIETKLKLEEQYKDATSISEKIKIKMELIKLSVKISKSEVKTRQQ